jgi:transposase
MDCRVARARTIGRGVWIGRRRRGFSAAVVSGSPAPVAVTYEAGPTGFGLAPALTDAGIDSRVAAPSKLQRPAGDRVKTDARDAAHLARLLHLGADRGGHRAQRGPRGGA